MKINLLVTNKTFLHKEIHSNTKRNDQNSVIDPIMIDNRLYKCIKDMRAFRGPNIEIL